MRLSVLICLNEIFAVLNPVQYFQLLLDEPLNNMMKIATACSLGHIEDARGIEVMQFKRFLGRLYRLIELPSHVSLKKNLTVHKSLIN